VDAAAAELLDQLVISRAARDDRPAGDGGEGTVFIDSSNSDLDGRMRDRCI
jgi:hypothetical protein